MTDRIAVKELRLGDAIDLEGDSYADPDRDHVAYASEYQIVHTIERETPDCIAIGIDNVVIGFPPDHLVSVIRCQDDTPITIT